MKKRNKILIVVGISIVFVLLCVLGSCTRKTKKADHTSKKNISIEVSKDTGTAKDTETEKDTETAKDAETKMNAEDTKKDNYDEDSFEDMFDSKEEKTEVSDTSNEEKDTNNSGKNENTEPSDEESSDGEGDSKKSNYTITEDVETDYGPIY